MKNRSPAVELPDDYEYDYEERIKIHRALSPVEITVAVQQWGPAKEEFTIVKSWVKKVRELYYTGGSPAAKVILGLVADTGVHYKNGEEQRDHCAPYRKKGVKLEIPIRLLQICAGGGHVLFFYCYSYYDEKFPRCLADLLIDTKTTVAAVGMKSLAEKLEKQFGLTLPRSTDLSRLAAYYDHCFVKPDGYDKISVMKLADEVYRNGDGVFDHDEAWKDLSGGSSGEKDMRWWERSGWWGYQRRKLSDEKIGTGALQAFLVCEMARKLLNRSGRIPLRG